MSQTPNYPRIIPELTQQIGRAILEEKDIGLFFGDNLEHLFGENGFSDLYPEMGRPSVHPVLLAVVTILQFWEDLPDRKGSEQVVKRIDWKYALRQELTWLGFSFSDLCRFRERLLTHAASERLFDQVLSYLREQGMLKKRGKQRTDSTHVLAHVSWLSRIERKLETLRLAVREIMSIDAVWLVSTMGLEWITDYTSERYNYRLSKEKLEALEQQVNEAGRQFMEALAATGREEWHDMEVLKLMRAIWQQDGGCLPDEVAVLWEKQYSSSKDDPPESVGTVDDDAYTDGGIIQSPHDPQARYSEKRSTKWVGYRTHFTETIEPGKTGFITDVLVTLAPMQDSQALATIQQRLIARDLCPQQQYVDQGYMSAAHIVRSAALGIALRGQVQESPSSKPVGFRLQDFDIDLQQQVARCPSGKESVRWSSDVTTKNVAFRAFFGKQCRTCPFFTEDACTTLASGRRLDITAHHDVLQARRAEQATPAFRTEMYQRVGIEATFSEGVRAHDLRHCRYRGMLKTQFQSAVTAAAMNLKRYLAHAA